MAEQVVASDPWGEIMFYDDWNTLELRWLPATSGGSEADLRATMTRFAAETETRKPTFLIVDTTDFFHRWSDDMMQWRNESIIPRYNAGGVTKFAFIARSDFPGETVETGAVPAPEGPANFPTGWFKSRDAAYQWLSS